MFRNVKFNGVEVAFGESKDGKPMSVEFDGNYQGYSYRVYIGKDIKAQSDSPLVIRARFHKLAHTIIEDLD
jgi:hypothetical protein